MPDVRHHAAEPADSSIGRRSGRRDPRYSCRERDDVRHRLVPARLVRRRRRPTLRTDSVAGRAIGPCRRHRTIGLAETPWPRSMSLEIRQAGRAACTSEPSGRRSVASDCSRSSSARRSPPGAGPVRQRCRDVAGVQPVGWRQPVRRRDRRRPRLDRKTGSPGELRPPVRDRRRAGFQRRWELHSCDGSRAGESPWMCARRAICTSRLRTRANTGFFFSPATTSTGRDRCGRRWSGSSPVG